MAGIEFDWDHENRKHLAAHRVAPVEFEQVLEELPAMLEGLQSSEETSTGANRVSVVAAELPL